jgi:hypothetical protein
MQLEPQRREGRRKTAPEHAWSECDVERRRSLESISMFLAPVQSRPLRRPKLGSFHAVASRIAIKTKD